jgi:hypothetical protein
MNPEPIKDKKLATAVTADMAISTLVKSLIHRTGDRLLRGSVGGEVEREETAHKVY